MISVVIATRNRHKALAEISLPSLLRQDFSGFEVILWDASDDALTEKVAADFMPRFAALETNLRYFKAPRPGSASQRNSAVQEAHGEIIFFLDDDVEIGQNVLRTVRDYFDTFSWLTAASPPLIDRQVATSQRNSFKFFFDQAARKIFYGHSFARRIVAPSTKNIAPAHDTPGTAEWLSGGCMAVRREIVQSLRFDERLERFGGYAYLEDADLSHRIYLHDRRPLLVMEGCHAIHHSAEGEREKKDWQNVAAFFYNTWQVRQNFAAYKKYPSLPFLWGLRAGTVAALLSKGYSVGAIIKGYAEYRKALHEK